MANTVRWYRHSDWNLSSATPVYTATVGGTAGEGIHYDGGFYYVLDSGTPSVIAYSMIGGTMYPSKRIWQTTFGTGTYTFSGLTGNGKDLFVASLHTFGAPITPYLEIIQLSKQGKYIQTFRQVLAGSWTPEGVAYNGAYLHEAINGGTFPATSWVNMIWMDGKSMTGTGNTGRTIEGYYFDSLQPTFNIIASGNRVMVTDHLYLGKAGRLSAALGQTVKDSTMVKDTTSQDEWCYGGFGGGEMVAVLSQA